METDETTKEELLRLERYAQNIPGGFHCCAEDPENGYPFTYISDRFLEILGWERAEFAARFDNRYTALVHPDDLATGLRYRNAENSATYAKNGDNIFRLLGKNGYRWVSSAANRVEWHGKGYIVATVTDITPYMELREKLEQQNRTQREALENANHNLLRMMQQMEAQKAQFAQTAARNMEKEKHYRQRLNRDALTPEQQDNIPLASALHDIGKIGIDEAILNKPGRLTAEEFAVIKTHSMLGAEMLHKTENFAEQPLLQTAYEIARWHHERWDGRGYPDGLKGDDIPISAQLVSMADVYDALTSERCYKKAFPHETAVQMITDGACGAFNPLLMQCLLDVQGELKQEILQW